MGQTIKVVVCYYQTSNCINVSVGGYQKLERTLGIAPASMANFRYEYREMTLIRQLPEQLMPDLGSCQTCRLVPRDAGSGARVGCAAAVRFAVASALYFAMFSAVHAELFRLEIDGTGHRQLFLDGPVTPAEIGALTSLNRGYFSEANLKVHIVEGTHGQATARVASTPRAIGVANLFDFLKARASGQRLIAFASAFARSPIVFYARRDSNVKSIADFSPIKSSPMMPDILLQSYSMRFWRGTVFLNRKSGRLQGSGLFPR